MLLKKRDIAVRQKKTFKDRVFFYKGILVVTSEQVAEFYECREYEIDENYNNNVKRFEEAKDFFRLTGKELVDFMQSNSEVGSENVQVLYLWTKRGVMIHAKMLDTRRAWEVWEVLEESYFEECRFGKIENPLTNSEKAMKCVCSMADQMVLDGIDESVAYEVARSAEVTFRLLVESGWRPRSFQQH